MVAATRRCSVPPMPRASWSAIVRDRSCSTGRYSTDTVMNIADQSSVMRPYSSSVSEWLASEKYANVIRPVAPIPTDRTAAPRPYDERRLEPDKQHGPGEGGARLLHRAEARQQRDEPALGPVVHVAGRVAEVAPVGAAGHVEAAPERLAGDRHQQVPARDARHLRHGRLGIRHVLQHLDGGREV